MSGRDLSILNRLPHLTGQLKEANEVGDGGSIEPDGLCDLFRVSAEFPTQPLKSEGLFNCIEVLSLDVLEQRELEHCSVVRLLPDRDRNLPQPRQSSRAPSTLTCDDLEVAAFPPNNDGLQNSDSANGVR